MAGLRSVPVPVHARAPAPRARPGPRVPAADGRSRSVPAPALSHDALAHSGSGSHHADSPAVAKGPGRAGSGLRFRAPDAAAGSPEAAAPKKRAGGRAPGMRGPSPGRPPRHAGEDPPTAAARKAPAARKPAAAPTRVIGGRGWKPLTADQEQKLRDRLEHAQDALRLEQEDRSRDRAEAEEALQSEQEARAADAEEAARQQEELRAEIERRDKAICQLESDIDERDRRIRKIEADRDARYAQYDQWIHDGERVRTELHNQLVDMKGNIRVYARVRPGLEDELGDGWREHYEFPEGRDRRELQVVDVPTHTSVVPGRKGAEPSQGKSLTFTFDRVFGPDTTQCTVFEEIGALVQSALDGYKVCIFAYGQTGSGKTYTMEGSGDGTATGMIPRAVQQVFDAIQWKQQRTGFKFRLTATFLEIYNEQFADLINRRSYGDEKIKHEVKHFEGETTVTGVEEVEVQTPEQVHQLLRVANENRRTRGTLMNEHSSRSHSVFMLKIKGKNEATQQTIHGQLNLIDLAGSERLAKSKSHEKGGEQLRETQHINKSLAGLGDVIAAMAKGDKHVPFRNSKLTYLLQPSMSSESKTLMFVNLSPHPAHLHESVCSLRFASKVNACEIGLARRRVRDVSVDGR